MDGKASGFNLLKTLILKRFQTAFQIFNFCRYIGVATAGVSIVSVFTTGGRILGGWACDRASIGAAKVLRFAPFVAVAPLVWAGAAESSVVAAQSALAAASITYGVFAAAVPVELRRRTGPRDFARAYGKVYTAWGVAGLAAPWLAGMFYDARGDYTMAGFCSIHPLVCLFVCDSSYVCL